jgi:hypothetical protein
MRVDHRALLVAEHEFDQPELIRLKARRPPERTAKGRVVARRECREHVPGLDELGHDPSHARQHLEGRLEIIGADPVAGGAQLVTDELQPQLGGLVLDDEQHLVVLSRPGTLRREELIEREVVAIAHLAAAEVDVRALVRGPRPSGPRRRRRVDRGIREGSFTSPRRGDGTSDRPTPSCRAPRRGP